MRDGAKVQCFVIDDVDDEALDLSPPDTSMSRSPIDAANDFMMKLGPSLMRPESLSTPSIPQTSLQSDMKGTGPIGGGRSPPLIDS